VYLNFRPNKEAYYGRSLLQGYGETEILGGEEEYLGVNGEKEQNVGLRGNTAPGILPNTPAAMACGASAKGAGAMSLI
jgi:hypothetical protein